MLDRHADVVNASARVGLGRWIRGRLKNGVQLRDQAASKDLATIQIPVAELRDQWAHQRTAQLSVRARRCRRLGSI